MSILHKPSDIFKEKRLEFLQLKSHSSIYAFNLGWDTAYTLILRLNCGTNEEGLPLVDDISYYNYNNLYLPSITELEKTRVFNEQLGLVASHAYKLGWDECISYQKETHNNIISYY